MLDYIQENVIRVCSKQPMTSLAKSRWDVVPVVSVEFQRPWYGW